LEAETKFIYIIHLKAFLCKLDNVLLLKCKYIFFIFESQITEHDVKPEFVLLSYPLIFGW